ncbi:group 1 truncated hemoglobin [Massilia sp. R2A-15]|uniref:group I truncated hemoglobin n=1 Tax=Massilia sp. R2A-15 TaxID=3064278 RepID=UPI002803E596|nr:group 1 truncated hemoglobin [Massilia sp. R2A-15]
MTMKSIAAALLALAVIAPVHAADDATYAGLGGQQGIRNIVATLIPLIQADPRIKESFADSDMKHIGMRLEEQFCMLSGGPCEYKGEPMKEVHGGLKVTNAQFNALAEDLQVAMERNGVPSHVQNKLVAKLAPMQREIVTK